MGLQLAVVLIIYKIADYIMLHWLIIDEWKKYCTKLMFLSVSFCLAKSLH